MKRWWASSEDSIAALSVVDDSDVVNGTGVAFLGYHGLVQKALQPLTKETLVDTHRVCEALSKVDLEPVMKALGEATKPVMGDASERYGQLLAEEIHKRAVVATERLLNTWTNNGMPWPQAIEKAAEVHGVPLERLGRYATVMKAVGITPLVRADYADRELMAYASEFGNREAVTDNALVIKQEKNLFREEDHPRNPNGEFKNKEDNVSSISDKLNRLNRINRMNRINGVNRKAAAAKKTEAVTEKPKEEKKFEEKPAFAAVKYGSVKYAPVNYGKKTFKAVKFPPRPPEGPKETDFKKIDDPFRWDKTVYIPINGDTFEKIKYTLNGYFFIGELNKNGIEAINEDEMEDWVKAQGNGTTVQSGIQSMRDNNVFLMRSNYTPVNRSTMDGKFGSKKVYDNLHEDTGSAHIVPRAKFTMAPNGGELLQIGGNSNMVFPAWLINLENSDFEDFSKSLQSVELQNFNEEHPRGEDGKFTTKDDVTDIRNARLDRINRMNRMNKVNNNNRAAQMKRLIEQRKLIDEKQAELERKFSDVKYGRVKYNDRKFGNVTWSNVNYGNKPLPKPLDIGDKLAMFVGMEVIGDIRNFDLASVIPLKIGDVKDIEDIKSPRPLIDESMYQTLNDDVPSASRTTALQKMTEDADNYYASHAGYADAKFYATDRYGDKEKFDGYSNLDDAMQSIAANAPKDLVEGTIVWQPFLEEVKNNYGDVTDDVYVGWEGNDILDAIRVVLGNKEDFEALRDGNATIQEIDGINCLADLLLKTTNKGEKLSVNYVFNLLFEGGTKNNIGSNPPIEAYTIKINNS